MKRNNFGINVDEGIALTTVQEFKLLYIEPEADIKSTFLTWLKESDQPALLGGQIGCGKTTLINYVLNESQLKPDLTFHFDKESLNLSLIDNWSIVFAEVFRYLAKHEMTYLEEIPVDIKNILGQKPSEWLHSITEIRIEVFSSAAMAKNKAFNEQLEKIQAYLPNLYGALVNRIEEKKGSPIFIFASGVDKFEPNTAAYFSLSEILSILAEYKTLFEVNAVHLFWNDSWMLKTQKIFISASSSDWIEQMLVKRLGTYADAYRQEILLIAKFSGGIPRQALRLLDSFLVEKKQRETYVSAFAHALENINRDFFAFGQAPEKILLQNIQKEKQLEISWISLPGDAETALRAIFGNWVILGSQKQESKWNALLNPIIKESLTQIQPETPEFLLLQKYAKQRGVSEIGLDINISKPNWQDILINHIETPIELNITEILDILCNALLSKQRADRVIIAYENKQCADIVRAYLEAKSNSYEYQVWFHTSITAEDNGSILHQLIEQISQHKVDIFSFEFNGEFPDEQLEELNLRRDNYIDKQMIWWIPKAKLNNYLSKWTQLRQLFQVFVLEEDLQRTLQVDEIESDLDFMRELAEEKGTAEYTYVSNLEVVLEYLKGLKHG